MGSLTLDEGLSKGEYRLLTAEEIKNLRESGQFAKEKRARTSKRLSFLYGMPKKEEKNC